MPVTGRDDHVAAETIDDHGDTLEAEAVIAGIVLRGEGESIDELHAPGAGILDADARRRPAAPHGG